MLDLKQAQKRIYQNKVSKGFNLSDIYREFCYLHGELTEACGAFMQRKDNIGEEFADVAIYLLGLSEILGIDLEREILSKMEKNEKRTYIQKDGVNIRTSDGKDSYICEHGYLHNYSHFNPEEYEQEMLTAKTYTNLDDMWAEIYSEVEGDDL